MIRTPPFVWSQFLGPAGRTMASVHSMAHYGADTAPPQVKAALHQLYLKGKKHKDRPMTGQPRVVACITGGGGQLFADMLREPGASSCLLEGIIPYEKESCLSFLGNHDRRAVVENTDAIACLEGEDIIGFCSADMAALLAESARDRALQLTPRLAQWPDCIGVSLTATILSHYVRRGPYRAHAGACGSSGGTSTYSHLLVKGARDRAGEDGACALLALRALTTAAGVEAATALESYGIYAAADTNVGANIGGTECVVEEPINNVGERASGVELVPAKVDRRARITDGVSVLVPTHGLDSMTIVAAPLNVLPAGTVVMLLDAQTVEAARGCFRAAARTLVELGREGDGSFGSWAQPPAPVLFLSTMDPSDAQKMYLEAAVAEAAVAGAGDSIGSGAMPMLSNWAVLSAQTQVATAVELIRRRYKGVTLIEAAEEK